MAKKKGWQWDNETFASKAAMLAAIEGHLSDELNDSEPGSRAISPSGKTYWLAVTVTPILVARKSRGT